MIRLLHIADVHLGASLSAFDGIAAERREAVLEAFRALPERAIELEVDAVLVAGDLFDSPQPARDLRVTATEVLRRMTQGGTPVFVVPGNHDPITVHPNPWGHETDGALGGAHVFREPRFDTRVVGTKSGDELRVHGVAYDPARCDDPLGTLETGEGDGGHDVVLVHASVQGAPHWKAGPNSLSVTADELAGLPVDYVALGDHHAFRGPADFPEHPDGAACCYPGSFSAVDLTETGLKGGVRVDLYDDGRVAVEPVPSGLTPIEDVGPVDVTTLEAHDAVVQAVVDRIGEGDVLPRVTLEGTPGFPLDGELVREHLVERYGLAAVRDRSRFYASGRIADLADDDTVTGHLVREGRRRIEAAETDEERTVREQALRITLSALEIT